MQRGPLFPLNSLMLHGLVYARHAKGLETDPQGDFAAEVRSYFGSGTQLQEMYVTPSLLGPSDWDRIAEAAKWSRASAATLRDAHWVGGDPARLDVYGWAAWSPGRGILTLRNPSPKARSFEVDPAAVWELPAGTAGRVAARSPWRKEGDRPADELETGRPAALKLEPYEVRTLVAEI